MKVYTKTDDNGMTSLTNGKCVQKDDMRVEAYGTIDELQSFVGMLASATDGLQLEDVRRVLFRIVALRPCCFEPRRATIEL